LISNWSDTDAVVNALMGSTSTSGSSTIHVPGFRCPQSPNLTCVDAYVAGEAEYDIKDGGPPQFNLPKIQVKYGVRSWDQFADDDPQGENSFPGNPGGPATYAVHSLDIGVESVKIPGSAFVFSDGALPFDVPAVIHVGVATLNVELKRVPYLPTITILKLIGKVNQFLFMGAPTGTLLFLGARTSKEFESDGTRVQNVSYTFKYRSKPWNYFIRPDNGQWDYISVRGEPTNRPYVWDDFLPLIQLQGFAAMGTLPAIEAAP
jgi:hypothetical protein